MSSNLDKYKKGLSDLIKQGNALHLAIQYDCFPEEFESVKKKLTKKQFDMFQKNLPTFRDDYQKWYSEAQVVIKLLLPDRLTDFIKLYEKPKGRKEISYENYVVQDYLQGLILTRGWEKEKIVGLDAAIPHFRQQLNILKSVERRFESSLFDIKQLVQADLFDSELDEAKELNGNGFFRAAGAIAGVVLEKHLSQVCDNHDTSIKKRHPTIADYNDALKNNGIIDTPQWRKIQHLGDLRNLCDHNKGRDPKKEEVEDLIYGVGQVIKNLF